MDDDTARPMAGLLYAICDCLPPDIANAVYNRLLAFAAEPCNPQPDRDFFRMVAEAGFEPPADVAEENARMFRRSAARERRDRFRLIPGGGDSVA
jgi:hypothetical protein